MEVTLGDYDGVWRTAKNLSAQGRGIHSDDGVCDGELAAITAAEGDVDRIARTKVSAAIDDARRTYRSGRLAQRATRIVSQNDRTAGWGFISHSCSGILYVGRRDI